MTLCLLVDIFNELTLSFRQKNSLLPIYKKTSNYRRRWPSVLVNVVPVSLAAVAAFCLTRTLDRCLCVCLPSVHRSLTNTPQSDTVQLLALPATVNRVAPEICRHSFLYDARTIAPYE